MAAKVLKALHNKQASAGDLLELLNKEVVPVLRELRDAYNGALGPAEIIDTNYFTSPEVQTYLVDASSGAITVTLPSVDSSAMEYVVKKVDSSANAVTVVPFEASTIDGAASKSLPTQYDSARFISDGENWNLV